MTIASKKKVVKSTKKTKEKKKVDMKKGSEKDQKKAKQKKSTNPKEPLKEQKPPLEIIIDGQKLSSELQKKFDSIPGWYMELYQYLHLFEELDIDVTKEASDSTNPKDIRFKAKVIERQLFLVFECLPKSRSGNQKVKLTQKQFAEQAGLSETILGMWKKEEWFWGNRLRLMKRIFSLHTPDVIEALYKGSTTASWTSGQYDAKCIKLWLEYVEGFVPGIDLTSKGEGLTIQFASGPSNFITAPDKDEK